MILEGFETSEPPKTGLSYNTVSLNHVNTSETVCLMSVDGVSPHVHSDGNSEQNETQGSSAAREKMTNDRLAAETALSILTQEVDAERGISRQETHHCR